MATINPTGTATSAAQAAVSKAASATPGATSTPVGSAVSDATKLEIARKVADGTPLADQNNAANAAEYKKQMDAMTAEIARKAAAGTALTNSTAYKDGLYKAATPTTTAGTGTSASPGFTYGYTGPDMTGMQAQLNNQYDQAYQAQLTALQNALQTQLQGYNSQETTANQTAYDNRNSNDVMSMQQMNAIKEQMANQGTAGGGDSITASLANQAARQNGANTINRDQANALQDISQKRSLAQNQEASNELALKQQLDSQKSGQLLDLLKYGDTMAYNAANQQYQQYQDQIQNDANYAGTYNGQQTQQAKQQQIQNDAQYGGTYNGQQTVAQQQQQWQNRFDYGNAIGQFSNGQKTLASKQLDTSNMQVMAELTGKMPDGTPTTAEQQRQITNWWQVAAQTGTIPNQLADMYGIPHGTKTQDAYQWAASFGLQQDQFQSGVDQSIYKMLQDGSQTQASSAVSDIAKVINSSPLLSQKNADGDPIAISDPTVQKQIASMIDTQTSDPIAKMQLYYLYGLTPSNQLTKDYTAAISAGK